MKKIVFFLALTLTFTAFSQNELPNVDLTTTDGKTITFKEAADKDGVVIVSLWATWCVPCLKELDAISEVWDEW